MPRLFLHIGFGKTGTTTIQQYFAGKLHEDSLRFFAAGVQGFAHHGLAAAALGDERLPWLDPYPLGRLTREAMALRIAGDIDAWASSEALSATRIVREGVAGTLRKALEGWEVHIVVYVRNQIDRIESAFLQRVKIGKFSGTFDDWIARLSVRPGEHTTIIQHYIDAFGKERVHVISYDENRRDIFAPIEQLTGIVVDRSFLSDRNVSGSVRSALVLRAISDDLGHHLSNPPWVGLRSVAERALAEAERQTLISPAAVEQLVAHYREENQKLLDMTGIDLNRFMTARADRQVVREADIDLGVGKSLVIAALMQGRGRRGGRKRLGRRRREGAAARRAKKAGRGMG